MLSLGLKKSTGWSKMYDKSLQCGVTNVLGVVDCLLYDNFIANFLAAKKNLIISRYF